MDRSNSWQSVALPVLEALARGEREGKRLNGDDLRAEVGASPKESSTTPCRASLRLQLYVDKHGERRPPS
jgi:hypothetical protein